MKCDKCKKNDANFHSITNINGKVIEKHLCPICAKEEKYFELNTNCFLNDFMNFKTSFSYFDHPLLDVNFHNFFNDDIFKDDLDVKLSKKKKQEILEKEKQQLLNEKYKREVELKKLDIQLKKAVVEERYEDAIVLRDKIKELKNQK